MIAAIASLYWFRLLLMLELTLFFGPLICIIIEMIKDLSRFIALGSIQLCAFSAIAILCFPEVENFQDFYTAAYFFLYGLMGSFDFS